MNTLFSIEDVKSFKEDHKDCKIIMSRDVDGVFIFMCHTHTEAVDAVMPEFCVKPSIDCAIAGYCKREIACNH